MAQLTETPLPHALAADALLPDAASIDAGPAIISEIHESAVPAFAAAALDRLHGSLYASLRHLQLCEADQPVPHTWIGYRRGEVIGVLLFRMRGTRAVVLTEMFALEQEVVDEFCRALFSRFAYADAICFNAIALPRPLVRGCRQLYAFSENYVIDLPASVEQYQAALGKSTRKTIKGYGNKLRRDHPDLSWEVCRGADMKNGELEDLVRRLQVFKRDSMALRGKRAEIDARDTERMITLATECGLIGIARIDGRICGGSLACRIGDNYVMLLSAADPALEAYRLGMLCCFWSVCDCIGAGARQCHLLWGRYQYKTQLLGVPQPLYRLNLYRSPLQMVLSPSAVSAMAWRGWNFRLRHWLLHEARDSGNGFARLAYQAVTRIRAARNTREASE